MHIRQCLFISLLLLVSTSLPLVASQHVHVRLSEQEVKEKHDSALGHEVGADYLTIIGLNNSDNRCFLNASLQAILHSAPFRHYLQKNAYPHGSFGNKLKDFSQKYAELAYRHEYENAAGSTESSDVKNALIKLHEEDMFHLDLSTNQQEDAAEVLAKILEKATLNPAHPATNPFCLQEVAQFQCAVCKDTYEKEYDEYKYSTIISLPIQKDTLKACLWDYFYGPLEKECAYHPQENSTFTKKITLKRAPAMLCIAFNRFTETFNDFVKDCKTVNFPAYNLDLRAYTEQEEPNALYDLVAMVAHKGFVLSSGHYIAYVKKDSGWYQCDDTFITKQDDQLSPHDVYFNNWTETPYLLFYKKREPAFSNAPIKVPRTDKKPKASPVPSRSLAQQLNAFFFSTPQRSLLSLSFFVGAFIVIKHIFMKPHG